MNVKYKQSQELFLIRIFYGLVLLAAILPIMCNYIIDGGIIREWVARIQELSQKSFLLYPTEGVYLESGINDNAFQSNVFFWGSGLFYRLTGQMVLTYRLTMLLIQLLGFLFARLFFFTYFEGEEKAAFFGVLLYMTCPYRIFVCYDWANMSLATAYMLVPLYGFCFLHIVRKRKVLWRETVLAAIALAGIGYAHHLVFFMVLSASVLAMVWEKTVVIIPEMVGGILLFEPGIARLLSYLVKGGFECWDLSLQPIMTKGYQLGNLLCVYQYMEGHPGIGLGLLFCLGAVVWVRFVNGKRGDRKEDKFFLLTGVLFLITSLSCFPWTALQRQSVWLKRWIGQWGTPSFFFGAAVFCFCLLGGRAMEQIEIQETEKEKKVQWDELVRLFVFLICLASCVYQCNSLTYDRLPLDMALF